MNPTDFTHAEPFAWAWRNKVTGAKGVYLEDPKPFGITSHPDYEWTNLYTEAQPIATLQAQPAEVSDEEIERIAIESEMVFRSGGKLLTPFLEHIDLTRNVRAFARAILALRPQAVAHEDWPLRAKVWRRDSTSEWVLEISGTLCDTYMHCRHTQPLSVQFEDVPGLPTLYEDAQAVPMTDEQRALIIGRAADKTVDRSAAALYAICETERLYGITAPAGGEKQA